MEFHAKRNLLVYSTSIRHQDINKAARLVGAQSVEEKYMTSLPSALAARKIACRSKRCRLVQRPTPQTNKDGVCVCKQIQNCCCCC